MSEKTAEQIAQETKEQMEREKGSRSYVLEMAVRLAQATIIAPQDAIKTAEQYRQYIENGTMPE